MSDFRNARFKYRGWEISLDEAIKNGIVKVDEYGNHWFKMSGNYEKPILVDIDAEKIQEPENTQIIPAT